jgi:methylglutaconyl-CoA hydratase
MMYKTLKVGLDARGVLTLSLNRPGVRNAFNDEVIEELTQLFQTDVLREQVRVVVLGGEGPTFCAGGDLNWMKRSVDFTYEENLSETRKLTHMFAVLNDSPKPLIGRVHGAAIGGGVGLVSVCDVVIAVKNTQFSLSEVRLGIVPACIGPFVVAKIGSSHARSLFISAERIEAQRAYEIGLIHQVVEDQAALSDTVERLVQQVLQCGPNALKIAKSLVMNLSWPEKRARCPDCLEYSAQTLADARVSEEGQEGLRAFLEKRKPTWL